MQFDPRYFDYFYPEAGRQPESLEDAAYNLATWQGQHSSKSRLFGIVVKPDRIKAIANSRLDPDKTRALF